METIKATELKNRLGEMLERAALGPLAIERHGRVVAYIVPPTAVAANAEEARPPRLKPRWSRRDEERVVELCASGDYRLSRWLRAGNPYMLAGVAVMLASQEGFNRTRMLALAERLHPGMSSPEVFGRWLAHAPVHAARFLPMLRARMRDSELERPALRRNA
jgi:antitoxin (DNA-binding transcriptional repressor) of toxin-antitoxin stability system